MDKLNNIIEQLVAEKSLSLEVLEQLKRIKDESNILTSENKQHLETIKNYSENNDKLINANKQLSSIIDGWKLRENNLISREKAVLDSEHKNEIQELKANYAISTLQEVKGVVEMVFKNVTVRKSIHKNKSIPVSNNGYVQNHNEYESYTEDQIEE